MQKEDQQKVELFENMPIKKAVAQLAIPTVVGCLVMILYNLADTYFVGMINNAYETAAVTVVAPVILAFNAVNNLFGVGPSSLMSRALGVKDYDLVKKTAAFGFYGALIFGLIFSLLCFAFKTPLMYLLGASELTLGPTSAYMFWTVLLGAVPSILNVVMGSLVRAEGSALHATIGTMSGCILNIILDPIFILPKGLNMGAAGAGCATFISNCVACLYFFVFIFVKRDATYVSINPKDFKPTGYIIKESFGVGVPAAIQNLLNVTGMTILNSSMAGYGDEAVAAIGIAHKTTMIPMYVAMGISQGVMPLVGYNWAAGNRKRMRDGIVFTAQIAGAFMIVATAGFYFGSEAIMEWFMDNELVVSYGGSFIRGLCLAQPFLAVDFLGVGIYQACGMGKMSFYFAIARKIVLEIPALLILDKLFPMYGLAYAQPIAEVILSVAAYFCIRKILNGSFGTEKVPKEINNTQ